MYTRFSIGIPPSHDHVIGHVEWISHVHCPESSCGYSESLLLVAAKYEFELRIRCCRQ